MCAVLSSVCATTSTIGMPLVENVSVTVTFKHITLKSVHGLTIGSICVFGSNSFGSSETMEFTRFL